MTRFFGMMPSDAVTIEEAFVDLNGLKVLIQAGPEGWSVIYADHSSEYEDKCDTPENNFDKAYRTATAAVGHLTKG